jgi:hypothetical protein
VTTSSEPQETCLEPTSIACGSMNPGFGTGGAPACPQEATPYAADRLRDFATLRTSIATMTIGQVDTHDEAERPTRTRRPGGEDKPCKQEIGCSARKQPAHELGMASRYESDAPIWKAPSARKNAISTSVSDIVPSAGFQTSMMPTASESAAVNSIQKNADASRAENTATRPRGR